MGALAVRKAIALSGGVGFKGKEGRTQVTEEAIGSFPNAVPAMHTWDRTFRGAGAQPFWSPSPWAIAVRGRKFRSLALVFPSEEERLAAVSTLKGHGVAVPCDNMLLWHMDLSTELDAR